MTILTVLILAAMLATVASLGFGVAAMVSGGEINHQGSAEWNGVAGLVPGAGRLTPARPGAPEPEALPARDGAGNRARVKARAQP